MKIDDWNIINVHKIEHVVVRMSRLLKKSLMLYNKEENSFTDALRKTVNSGRFFCNLNKIRT
jgi:hypothetical protein